MKYCFVQLEIGGKNYYIEPRYFDYYIGRDLFRDNKAVNLVIFENIYIGCFPRFIEESDIFDYNDEAVIKSVLPLSDISFINSTVRDVCKSEGCFNA